MKTHNETENIKTENTNSKNKQRLFGPKKQKREPPGVVFHVLHTLLHFAQEHRQNRRSVCLSRIPQCWKRQTLLHFAGQASARRRRVCLSRIPQCWKRQTLLYFGAGVRGNIASVCLFEKRQTLHNFFVGPPKKLWSVCVFHNQKFCDFKKTNTRNVFADPGPKV